MNKTFPPPGYISTESLVTGIEVYKPAPVKIEDERETVEFKCPQCGATTAYSVVDGGLTCTHCGYYDAPQKPVVGKQAGEMEFTPQALAQALGAQSNGRITMQRSETRAQTPIPEQWAQRTFFVIRV